MSWKAELFVARKLKPALAVLELPGMAYAGRGGAPRYPDRWGGDPKTSCAIKVDAAADLRQRLQSDLRAAMKARAGRDVAVLRQLIAAIDNAGAVPVRPKLNRSSAKLSVYLSGSTRFRHSCNTNLIYAGAPPMNSAAWAGRLKPNQQSSKWTLLRVICGHEQDCAADCSHATPSQQFERHKMTYGE